MGSIMGFAQNGNNGVIQMSKPKQKFWSTYIMVLNHKIYLRKSMTTMEAIKWLKENCKMSGTDYFMCGNQVFCECK